MSTQTEDGNAHKLHLIRGNLETAIDFARIALRSHDEMEAVRCRQKACEAYEEALHDLKTTNLTDIEWESVKSMTERFESFVEV